MKGRKWDNYNSIVNKYIKKKNNLTIGGRSGKGTVRRGDYRKYYKGHMDRIKGEGGGGGGRGV